MFAISPVAALLSWYDQHRRRLPWRALPGKTPDPYHVWLSEIMLQQTTVAAVIPYYEGFLRRFPDLGRLAAAAEEDVLVAWAGLGYYARARNLHACARAVEQSGFPRDLASLLALPGIGPYTAAAIAAIAFEVPVIPVDGNVERVVARLFAVTDILPAARARIRAHAANLGTFSEAHARPSDTAQALFDLGATICTPTSPSCVLCPLSTICRAHRDGIAAILPRKAPKLPRPQRFGAHFWLTDTTGQVLLRRRPSHGLLGGMAELPGTPWRADPWNADEAHVMAPMPAKWSRAGAVHHVFTHFELSIEVFTATVPQIAAEGFLCPAAALSRQALPSVMRKCVVLAQQHAGENSSRPY